MSLLHFILRACLSLILSGPNIKPTYRLSVQVHILKQTSLILPFGAHSLQWLKLLAVFTEFRTFWPVFNC